MEENLHLQLLENVLLVNELFKRVPFDLTTDYLHMYEYRIFPLVENKSIPSCLDVARVVELVSFCPFPRAV